MVPRNHPILLNISSSFEKITPSDLVKVLGNYKLCSGINATNVMNSVNISRHVIPLKFNFEEWKSIDGIKLSTNQVEYLRANTCSLLISIATESDTTCAPCKKLAISTEVELRRKFSHQKSPVSSKAPVSLTSPDRLKATLQQQRLVIKEQAMECSQLKEQMEKLQQELKENSCKVDEDLQNDLVDIFKGIILKFFCLFF